MCVEGGGVVNKNIQHYNMGAQEEEHRELFSLKQLYSNILNNK